MWLAVGRTDMRKGMNGLALQVQQALAATRTPAICTFFAAPRRLIKIMWQDGIGMCLFEAAGERPLYLAVAGRRVR